MHHTGQVITDRVQVDRVLQPGRERRHGLVGVIPGPVEPPVYHLLHPPAQRVEQGRCRQSRGRHLHRRGKRRRPGQGHHSVGVHPDEQSRHNRIRQGPGDQPVDVIQPVLQDRDTHADRQREDRDRAEGAHNVQNLGRAARQRDAEPAADKRHR